VSGTVAQAALGASAHLIAAPVVLPLAAGSLLLLLERVRPGWVAPASLAATLGFLAVALALAQRASSGVVEPYLMGNWQAPWGIALALDRLSALMLLLLGVLAVACLAYALGGRGGGDHRRGPHFHALFQFQLMGLAGAFLTGDLFNLFVFFEVLLAASYGLLLHGDGAGQRARVTASVHYVVFNLVGSALFLIAVSMLYGLAGTLNMADLAQKLPQLPADRQALAQAAALLLLVVFAVKAALLPLYFWLPATYSSATAPVAALFAIMTKVGVYAIARVTTLIFGTTMVEPLLTPLALGTLALAAIGALAAPRLRALVAFLVVGSAGMLLLALGLGTPGTVSAGLFYLVHSTLVAAFLFLLVDRIALARGASDALQPRPLTGHWGVLGAAFFVGAVAVAGVPPLTGFLGKSLLLQAAGTTPWAGWVVALVLASSFLLVVAMARAGSTVFWEGGRAEASNRPSPDTPKGTPAGAKLALVALALGLGAITVGGGRLAAYTDATAAQMFDREAYIRAVLSAPVAPPAHDIRREMREREQAKAKTAAAPQEVNP
jgi:multicomponent K+:H+ antiporter subunit D